LKDEAAEVRRIRDRIVKYVLPKHEYEAWKRRQDVLDAQKDAGSKRAHLRIVSDT
jgi:hypothetical protein